VNRSCAAYCGYSEQFYLEGFLREQCGVAICSLRFVARERGTITSLDNETAHIAGNINTEKVILVCVVSSNERLAEACRTSLDRICPAGYDIQECEPPDVPNGCAIYIWDCDSRPSVPPAMVTAEAAKIVIVKKTSLSSIRRKVPDKGFTYLESPFTPLSLTAVLQAAVAQLELRQEACSTRLKLDRDRILQQLLETNLSLREHDQDRTNFLARSIHDIRVPLTAIRGYCGMLLAGQVGSIDPEQTRILERMQRSVSRLCRLVEAVMDLGTGSPGANKLTLEPASIEACAHQAVYEILPSVQRKQISVTVDVQSPTEVLLFDAGQLEQVLTNLLDNACKFTPKGGEIIIRGRSITTQGLWGIGSTESTAAYRVDVTDTGRGIDPGHMEQIFDEHTSYGDSTDRTGSGLGLAICRMIIHAHKGRIWTDPGTQGASFSFVLPFTRSFNHTLASQAAV
jgi:signal transduction histidine kinase